MIALIELDLYRHSIGNRYWRVLKTPYENDVPIRNEPGERRPRLVRIRVGLLKIPHETGLGNDVIYENPKGKCKSIGFLKQK